jgi:hypothetical protein
VPEMTAPQESNVRPCAQKHMIWCYISLLYVGSTGDLMQGHAWYKYLGTCVAFSKRACWGRIGEAARLTHRDKNLTSNCELRYSLTPPVRPIHHRIQPRRPRPRLHGFPAQTHARTSSDSRSAPAFEVIPQPSFGATIPLKLGQNNAPPPNWPISPYRTASHRIASHRDIVDSYRPRATTDRCAPRLVTRAPTPTYSRKLRIESLTGRPVLACARDHLLDLWLESWEAFACPPIS